MSRLVSKCCTPVFSFQHFFHFHSFLYRTILLRFVVEWQCVAIKQTNNQSIIGESAVQTLKYSHLHKLTVNLPDDSKGESQLMNLAKRFGISDKQSLAAMIHVNSELKKWEDIEQLLVVKVLELSYFYRTFAILKYAVYLAIEEDEK